MLPTLQPIGTIDPDKTGRRLVGAKSSKKKTIQPPVPISCVANLGATFGSGLHGCMTGSCFVDREINVLALVKGDERYVFLYDDANRAETLRMLGRFASNADLSFTWYDAAVLSQRVRQGSVPIKKPARPRFSVDTTPLDESY